MDTELLQIEPSQLTFVFELKKQSSCLVHLANKAPHSVAFKVKTTSPTKYCVRPTIGIIKPNETCDFTVTMQAMRTAPLDFHCKDKFLILSTFVPPGATQDDISSDLFAKDSGKHVEEKKLRVVLVPAVNQDSKQDPPNQKNKLSTGGVEFFLESAPMGDMEQDRTDGDFVLRPVENVSDMKMQPNDGVQLGVAKDSQELKLKLSEMDSKLREAEGTIMKLNEERRRNTREKDLLKQELEVLKRKINMKRVPEGFPFLFVCVVALVSVAVGYYVHP